MKQVLKRRTKIGKLFLLHKHVRIYTLKICIFVNVYAMATRKVGGALPRGRPYTDFSGHKKSAVPKAKTKAKK